MKIEPPPTEEEAAAIVAALETLSDEGQQVSSLARVFDPESIGSEEPDVNDLGIIIGRRLLDLLNGTVRINYLDTKGMETKIEVAGRPSKG